jgi:glycosyltransferase involved in cell wall biosynthesis
MSIISKGLFITPIAPMPGGNGLAMRAALTLQGLARVCKLTTMVAPVSQPEADQRAIAWAARRSQRCILLPLPTPVQAAHAWLSNPDSRRLVAALQPLPQRARLADPFCVQRALADSAFDLVWVLRLYLAPTALPFLARAAYRVLDLDEDDAATLRAIADLHHRRGEAAEAAGAMAEAEAYRRMGGHCIGWFDQVATASKLEAEALPYQHSIGASVSTIPNAVATDVADAKAFARVGPATLVFVGNMDYMPNIDAAERLANSLLPAIRRRLPGAELHLAGSGRGCAKVMGRAGVRVHGFVADLARLYRLATVAVVPLRAGGGSRLKLLEAFAHGVPVVATAAAAAGLEVYDGEQLLIAEDDAGLVEAALRVATDIQLARRLTAAASRFVAEKHDLGQVAGQIAFQVLSATKPCQGAS